MIQELFHEFFCFFVFDKVWEFQLVSHNVVVYLIRSLGVISER